MSRTPEEIERIKRDYLAARAAKTTPTTPSVGKQRALVRSALVFVALAGAGLGALETVGVVVARSPITNVVLVLAGAAAAALGFFVMQRPTAFTIARSEGTDAFGMQQWGRSQPATARQGTQQGAIFLAVGVGVLVLGVFMGALTRG